jgi:hypothetical protein
MVHPMSGDKKHWLVPVTTAHALRSLLFWMLLILNPVATMADEIIMTTGETFSSPKVWEEDGKIRFSMHGLMVSVEKSEVAQIIRNQDSPQPTRKPIQPRVQAPVAPLSPQPPEPTIKSKPLERTPANRPGPVKASAAGGIGLAGISWHLQLSDLPDLKKLETDPMYGGIDQYYRENETMTLGPVALDGKVYGFWRNRLYMITMWVEGPPAYKRLRKAVFERYGRGSQNNDGLERYVWEDPTTDRMLEFDEQLNTGLFWMRSRALDDKIKQLYGN